MVAGPTTPDHCGHDLGSSCTHMFSECMYQVLELSVLKYVCCMINYGKLSVNTFFVVLEVSPLTRCFTREHTCTLPHVLPKHTSVYMQCIVPALCNRDVAIIKLAG